MSDGLNYCEYDDGTVIDCISCVSAHGVVEFFGYCPGCWKDLEPAERAILKGQEPPVEKIVREVVHHRDEVTTHKEVVRVQELVPPPGKARTVALLAWMAALTVSVAWLAWRAYR